MNRMHKHIAWGAVLVVLGLLLLFDAFGVIDFWWNFWKLWPLILVWWGIRILRRGHRDEALVDGFGDRTLRLTDETISQDGIFGDIRITVAGEIFRGGTVSNVFGDVFVDLGDVGRVVGEARLLVKCVFGDIRIRLPKNVEYTIDGSSAFGHTAAPGGARIGKETFTSGSFEGAPDRLRLSVSCTFGDIDVMQ